MKGAGKQTTTTEMDPQTQKMRQEVFDRARMVSNQPYTPYTGEGVAGMSPASRSALGAMPGLMGQYGNIRDFLSGNLLPGGVTPNGYNPQLGAYQNAGVTGANALGGDKGAIASLMNPYISNVIDASHGAFDKLRSQAALGANDAATRAGAFGGDRAALMKGARLGEVDSAEGQSIANLLSGGYDNAMNRAGAAANLGLSSQDLASRYGLGLGQLNLGAGQLRLGQGQALTGAANSELAARQAQFGMGDMDRQIQQARDDYARNQFLEGRDWNLRGLNILQGGLSGTPSGQSTSTPLQRNAFSGMAGGALTGSQIAGPYGAVVGGLGGLLFG